MSKSKKSPRGPRPPKAWVAEPYQRGQIYYDPTTEPGPLRMALIWFTGKYPNLSPMLFLLLILVAIGGYGWFGFYVFLQAHGKSNIWFFLGIGLLCLPFVALLVLIAFGLRKLFRGMFSKRGLLPGSPRTKKPKLREWSSGKGQPFPLVDPNDPAGFAHRLPKQRKQQRVQGMMKVPTSSSRSQNKEPRPQKRPRRPIARKQSPTTTQKLSEDDC